MNKQIVISVLIIGGSGVYAALSTKKPLTKVILGSYILLLVLSLLDAFGGEFSVFAGALSMLAATYVLLTEFPWQSLVQVANNGVAPKGQGRTPGNT